MKKRLLTLVVIALAGLLPLRGQNLSDLRITEAVVENLTGVVDENGERTPWVELTNNSQGTVNFAGCFLTDDPDNLKKYMVPKGVLANRLGARQVTLLRPDFPIRKGTTIYLVSTDGKTVIDSIEIPADLPADMSVRKIARDNKQMDFRTDAAPAVPTPGAMNTEGLIESGAERMARTDPHGGILTVTSVSVVFSALLILLIIFTISGNAFSGKYKKARKAPKAPKAAKAGAPDEETAAAIAMALSMEGGEDEVAAIAMALDLYLSGSAHDAESYTLTLADRPSAWRDKARMFRKSPR